MEYKQCKREILGKIEGVNTSSVFTNIEDWVVSPSISNKMPGYNLNQYKLKQITILLIITKY